MTKVRMIYHATKFVAAGVLALGFCYGLGTMLGGA